MLLQKVAQVTISKISVEFVTGIYGSEIYELLNLLLFLRFIFSCFTHEFFIRLYFCYFCLPLVLWLVLYFYLAQIEGRIAIFEKNDYHVIFHAPPSPFYDLYIKISLSFFRINRRRIYEECTPLQILLISEFVLQDGKIFFASLINIISGIYG